MRGFQKQEIFLHRISSISSSLYLFSATLASQNQKCEYQLKEKQTKREKTVLLITVPEIFLFIAAESIFDQRLRSGMTVAVMLLLKHGSVLVFFAK